MQKRAKVVIGAVLAAILVLLVVVASFTISGRVGTTEKVVRGTEIGEPGIFSLTDFEENITIVAPGDYRFYETATDKTIFVDAEGEVTIILDGVTINNSKTAGIVNLTGNKLTVALAEGTTNKITGGSRSKYRAPIYSSGDILVVGEGGALVLQNNYGEGKAFISEGEKIEIGGGVIVLALTAGDYDFNKFVFHQKKLAFDLDETAKAGTKISIVDKTASPVCQFETETQFKKVVLNADYLENEKYFLYLDEQLAKSGVAE